MNIAPQDIPKGIDYQLVTVSVMGDTSYSQLAEFEKNGWRRVPVARHPNIRSTDPKWMEQGGLALVERPQLLTERAKVYEQNKADAQLLSVAAFNSRSALDHDLSEILQVPLGDIPATVNGRPINMQATVQRKRTLKEFFVLHLWRLRVWVRDKFADWRTQ